MGWTVEDNPYKFKKGDPRASECGKKGVVKCHEKMRQRRKIRAALEDILALPLNDDVEVDAAAKKILELYGVTDAMKVDAMSLAMVLKAQNGDVDAARFTRDTVGERPSQAVEVGNMDDKPFETLDLGAMSDDELQRMAAMRQPELLDEPDDAPESESETDSASDTV